eukprot:2563359-Pyramimonas_sp.AAC.1
MREYFSGGARQSGPRARQRGRRRVRLRGVFRPARGPADEEQQALLEGALPRGPRPLDARVSTQSCAT